MMMIDVEVVTKVFMKTRIKDGYVVGYASNLVEIADLNESFPSSEYMWTECKILSHNRLITENGHG